MLVTTQVVRLKVLLKAGLGKTGIRLVLSKIPFTGKPCLVRESALFAPQLVNRAFWAPSAFSLNSFNLTR